MALSLASTTFNDMTVISTFDLCPIECSDIVHSGFEWEEVLDAVVKIFAGGKFSINDVIPAVSGIVAYKAVPLQAWTGPKGSRRLRFPDFKTIGT